KLHDVSWRHAKGVGSRADAAACRDDLGETSLRAPVTLGFGAVPPRIPVVLTGKRTRCRSLAIEVQRRVLEGVVAERDPAWTQARTLAHLEQLDAHAEARAGAVVERGGGWPWPSPRRCRRTPALSHFRDTHEST